MLNFEEGTAFSLIIESRSDATNRVRISGATRSGPFTIQHTPLSTKALKTEAFRLPDMPIFITVDTIAGSYARGDCYVALNLGINDDKVYKLCAGYIYAEVGITWPTANIEKPTDGLGLLTTIVGATPATGAEATLTVPSGEIWKVHMINLKLACAATAGSRRAEVQFDDGIGRKCSFISPVDQIASETKTYTLYPGATFGATGAVNEISAPMAIGLIAPAGSVFTTNTGNLAAGDAYEGINIKIERFYAPI